MEEIPMGKEALEFPSLSYLTGPSEGGSKSLLIEVKSVCKEGTRAS